MTIAHDYRYGLAANRVHHTGIPGIGDGGIKAGRINSNSLRGRTAGSTSEPFKAVASGIGHG